MNIQPNGSTEYFKILNDNCEFLGKAYLDRRPSDYRGIKVTCYDDDGVQIVKFYTDLPINRIHDEILQAYKEHYND